MAINVFGNPVTDETVKLVYPSLTQITAQHRAQVALLYMNAEGRATEVTQYVHELKDAWGEGTSTLCMIYNATGDNVSFVLSHSWEGSIVSRAPYPQVLRNGQWAGMLHVRSRLIGPSKEAVIYQGKINNGEFRDWMLCWNTPRLDWQNRVYAAIDTAGAFASVNWDTIDASMEK